MTSPLFPLMLPTSSLGSSSVSTISSASSSSPSSPSKQPSSSSPSKQPSSFSSSSPSSSSLSVLQSLSSSATVVSSEVVKTVNIHEMNISEEEKLKLVMARSSEWMNDDSAEVQKNNGYNNYKPWLTRTFYSQVLVPAVIQQSSNILPLHFLPPPVERKNNKHDDDEEEENDEDDGIYVHIGPVKKILENHGNNIADYFALRVVHNVPVSLLEEVEQMYNYNYVYRDLYGGLFMLKKEVAEYVHLYGPSNLRLKNQKVVMNNLSRQNNSCSQNYLYETFPSRQFINCEKPNSVLENTKILEMTEPESNVPVIIPSTLGLIIQQKVAPNTEIITEKKYNPEIFYTNNHLNTSQVLNNPDTSLTCMDQTIQTIHGYRKSKPSEDIEQFELPDVSVPPLNWFLQQHRQLTQQKLIGHRLPALPQHPTQQQQPIKPQQLTQPQQRTEPINPYIFGHPLFALPHLKQPRIFHQQNNMTQNYSEPYWVTQQLHTMHNHLGLLWIPYQYYYITYDPCEKPWIPHQHVNMTYDHLEPHQIHQQQPNMTRGFKDTSTSKSGRFGKKHDRSNGKYENS
ncbi:hypothetical protein HELRODRAFT_193202 [Helobdella robusta]|uniref:Uncharacterized protein n=1 Tax=Helobdella robusta TaxID=6412 RepID=T1FUR0_HELRO|nr:hypothetical protein HELRODRAFT_193202 [Helobdella robusta]ESN97805.1 hypothetical protein HELRODRAFT_193202 [Helobdella robusta]